MSGNVLDGKELWRDTDGCLSSVLKDCTVGIIFSSQGFTMHSFSFIGGGKAWGFLIVGSLPPPGMGMEPGAEKEPGGLLIPGKSDPAALYLISAAGEIDKMLPKSTCCTTGYLART